MEEDEEEADGGCSISPSGCLLLWPARSRAGDDDAILFCSRTGQREREDSTVLLDGPSISIRFSSYVRILVLST